jgi:hypothetical protein
MFFVISRLTNSTQRRNNRSESLRKHAWFVMRLCSTYMSRHILCSMSEVLDSCVECNRTHRRCELASPMAEVKRLASKAEDLREQALETERKTLRLRKQARALYKKMRDLGARKE